MKENKNIEKMLEKLKVNGNQEQFEKFKKLANSYSDKPENEIMDELMQLKEKLKAGSSDEEFNKKLKRFEKIRPFLNNEQQKKLDGLLNLLKDN
ncbi:hypothetical protein [Abyssisolibacter fermentans]|uniref:hypothetical protein n=1 Tax=Abyssisolibacter fermentans TaxID=1766203 RepID=UPI00082EBFB6|nr:hypothetical protein [Abyssisolibacter fermentans]